MTRPTLFAPCAQVKYDARLRDNVAKSIVQEVNSTVEANEPGRWIYQPSEAWLGGSRGGLSAEQHGPGHQRAARHTLHHRGS